jgi:uncharacterized protein involved in exopolysaccharide biosynthesis
MLQTYSAAPASLPEDRTQAFEPRQLIALLKRRIFYFAVPFVVFLIVGCLIVAIQRPIYQAQGEILVESPEIPTDLVQPTVTSAATERIQVIQQRLMARDNLLPIVDKFNLFPSERRWMSGTQLLDLMRERAAIALVDVDMQMAGGKPVPSQNAKNSAVAFTVSFEYENPDLAAKVANELLTAILSEDVQSRTSRATETTEFLAQEVKRLQGRLDAINGQIFSIKQHAADDPKHGDQELPEQLKMQTDELTAMKADLLQKSSVYSDEYPAIKALKKRIAALEHQIASTPKVAQTPPAPGKDIDALLQQQDSIAKELDTESKKLTAAQLGEAMERNQQSEHLQVIEQPVVPQKPVKPNRPKLFGLSFALAAAAGAGIVVLAEMFDRTIRGPRELATVVDSRLLVAIPYITTTGEITRRKRRIILLWAFLAAFLVLGIAAALYIGIEIDFSWFDRSWIDALTRLSK